MHRRVVLFAIALAALPIVGCAGSSSSTFTVVNGTTAAPTSPAESLSPVRIEVTLDEMAFTPSEFSVPSGVPVTFVVTNAGEVDHEFYLGNEEAQQEHEQEMSEGGMSHDEPNGVTVAPGATKEFDFTFTLGEWLAGCHEPGHYSAGMKAVVSLTD